MQYREKQQDLFATPPEYYLVHCISADFAMGAGIAVQFNRQFSMRDKLRAAFPDYLADWQVQGRSYDCLLEERVFNLITKERYYQKPTYQSLEGALKLMQKICRQRHIRLLAMPLIGCGLDKLQWPEVSAMIKTLFAQDDLEILVCIK